MLLRVRCGAERPAPAQLRGAATPATVSKRVAPASRRLQGTRRRARLDQGCAARLVACASAGPESGSATPHRHGRARQAAGGEAALAEPAVREQAASDVELEPEEAEEEAAVGALEPDPLTVARLARPGWFKTEEAARALLLKAAKRHPRTWPSETALPAADWLESMLGPSPVTKDGLCPAAKAVKLYPRVLAYNVETLQSKWDALTLPTEHGGVGIGFLEEQAREAVRKHPRILSYAVDKLARGWSMLTATEHSVGLSPDEARHRILFSPNILLYDYDSFVRRVGLLKDLGYADARRMLSANSRVLNFKDEVVKAHAAWWEQTELDHVKLITAMPTLLGSCSTTELQEKLDFLSRVAGMSTEELNNAPLLFGLSSDGRLRARYFYALLKGRLARFTSINSMMQVTDAAFLAVMQGGSYTERASDLEVKRYQKLVASAKFAAWRQRQEAQRRRGAP